MGLEIKYSLCDYVHQHYYEPYRDTKRYRHHNHCGLCGQAIDLKPKQKEYITDHIREFHPEKMMLIEPDPLANNKFNELLNFQDLLEFDLFRLQVIESCLNGAYRGWSHPRYHRVRMQDAITMMKYRLLKINEQILDYDMQFNTHWDSLDYSKVEENM